jgi:CheY-like chemotaxis protein
MKCSLVLLTRADPVARCNIAAALNRFGYDVLMAWNGEAALSLLQSERSVGVLVADVETGGLALAQEAHALRPNLGVIYTSVAPYRVAENSKVRGAPLLRVLYGVHQLVGVITGLGRRVLDEASPSCSIGAQ